MMLQFDDPRDRHLHAIKYRNDFQDLVVKGWCSKYLKEKGHLLPLKV